LVVWSYNCTEREVKVNLSIDVVAWCGAITGGLAFIFQVWTWWRGRKWMRLSIHGNTYYEDRFSKVEKTEHGESRELVPHFRIEVANIGDLPTTITSISAVAAPRGLRATWRWLRRAPRDVTAYGGSAFEPHDGKHLPHLLGPGEVWVCRTRAQVVDTLAAHGKVFLSVKTSSSRTPVRRKFPISKQAATEN
jgi:hypothetical protein